DNHVLNHQNQYERTVFMGFLDRFTKKKTTSDCCSIDIVPDDDAATASSSEDTSTDEDQADKTQRSTSRCNSVSSQGHLPSIGQVALNVIGCLVIDVLGYQAAHSGCKVVADQPHPVYAFDPSGGGFVGDPAFYRGLTAVGQPHVCIRAQHDELINPTSQLPANALGTPLRHIHSNFGQRGDGVGVECSAGCGASGVNFETIPCVVVGNGSGHLGFAAIANTNKQY